MLKLHLIIVVVVITLFCTSRRGSIINGVFCHIALYTNNTGAGESLSSA